MEQKPLKKNFIQHNITNIHFGRNNGKKLQGVAMLIENNSKNKRLMIAYICFNKQLLSIIVDIILSICARLSSCILDIIEKFYDMLQSSEAATQKTY